MSNLGPSLVSDGDFLKQYHSFQLVVLQWGRRW